jgi:pilus assembly protein CpaE
VTDLVDVAEDLTPRQIEETVYVHPTKMRVLLAPKQGEHAEDVSAQAARAILGAMKFRYNIMVVDVGTVVSEASAVAVEMADQVLVVTTPDVPALRAANRIMALWERLAVRKPESCRVLVNKVNKQLEVQPDLVRRVVNASIAKAVVPASFKELEPAVNTGVPDRLTDGALRQSFLKLGQEVGIVPTGKVRRKLALRPSASEAGQAAVETMGITFILLVTAVALWQMVLIGYTYILAGHAAREGARELAVGDSVRTAVVSDLPDAWRDGLRIDEGSDWVEVDLAVPVLIPGTQTPVRIAVKAGTVVESGAVP